MAPFFRELEHRVGETRAQDIPAALAARARLAAAAGEGETHCVECGEEIPEGRRRAVPGARTCVACQSGRDARTVTAGFNRRGSKDSQLR